MGQLRNSIFPSVCTIQKILGVRIYNVLPDTLDRLPIGCLVISLFHVLYNFLIDGLWWLKDKSNWVLDIHQLAVKHILDY